MAKGKITEADMLTIGRAGSVWIFQIRFDSVRFSISGTRFQFFSVSVFAHHHNEIFTGARSG